MNHSLNIYLLEDETAYIKEFQEYLSSYLEKEYKKEWAFYAHSTSDELMIQMNAQHPDLFIVDIVLEEENVDGIDIAREVYTKYPDCSIVFLTSHLLYSLEVYDVKPLFFILKPELQDRWPHVFELFLQKQLERTQLLSMKQKGVPVTIPLDSIIYCEHGNKNTTIHTTSGRYVFRITLSELLEKLPSESFAFCHQSFLVNLSYVTRYSQIGITLSTGTEIPLGRKYVNSFRTIYAKWLKKRI